MRSATSPASCPQAAAISSPRVLRVVTVSPALCRTSAKRLMRRGCPSRTDQRRTAPVCAGGDLGAVGGRAEPDVRAESQAPPEYTFKLAALVTWRTTAAGARCSFEGPTVSRLNHCSRPAIVRRLRFDAVGDRDADVMTSLARALRGRGIARVELAPIADPAPLCEGFMRAGWLVFAMAFDHDGLIGPLYNAPGVDYIVYWIAAWTAMAGDFALLADPVAFMDRWMSLRRLVCPQCQR